jgi:hypothetical protein
MLPQHFLPRPSPNRDGRVAVASSTSLARVVIVALLCAALSSSACSSDPASPDERSCQGEVGADCPATFDDVLAETWTCQDRETIWAGECMTNGPLTLQRNWGTHQTNCFYDPTSRQLVGANRVNDTPAYCNNTSASISTGDVPVPYPHYCVGSGAGTQRSQSCGNP